MIKTNQILHILFLFIILIEKAKFQGSPGLSTTDLSTTDLPTTDLSTTDLPTTYLPINDLDHTDLTTSLVTKETTKPTEDKIDIEKRLCKDTQPLKGIKEECFNGNIISSNEVCCYMTIKYETNEHYSCIAVSKDKKTIKDTIKALKQEYESSKSIDIDCNSSLIKISLISILLIFIF